MSRSETFPPDGKRIIAPATDIVSVWRSYSVQIPAQYALGTAQHETNWTLNEVDTEDSGFVSMGIFQLSDEERKQVGLPAANLLALEDACKVLALVAAQRLTLLLQESAITDPPYPSDIWAYLAVAHNEGTQAALKTIRRHGLDWMQWKRRNFQQLGNMCNYGDDCISGGSKWSTAFNGAPLSTTSSCSL